MVVDKGVALWKERLVHYDNGYFLVAVFVGESSGMTGEIGSRGPVFLVPAIVSHKGWCETCRFTISVFPFHN